jgi:hypothetical protein
VRAFPPGSGLRRTGGAVASGRNNAQAAAFEDGGKVEPAAVATSEATRERGKALVIVDLADCATTFESNPTLRGLRSASWSIELVQPALTRRCGRR